MVERGQQPALALEPGKILGVGCEWRRQDFQRDLPSELRVACAVDDTHSAFAQFGEDFIGAESLTDHWPDYM